VRKAVLLSAILAIAGLMPPRGVVAAAPAPRQAAPRFRSGVDVVEVAVLARDREGKPVTDLARDEASARTSDAGAGGSDAGRRQEIRRPPGR
jgi:hypothetical protein